MPQQFDLPVCKQHHSNMTKSTSINNLFTSSLHHVTYVRMFHVTSCCCMHDKCHQQSLLCCRFAAVVELEMALVGNPDKKMLMRALARRRDNQFDNFFDRLITELFITGKDAALHAVSEARRCSSATIPTCLCTCSTCILWLLICSV